MFCISFAITFLASLMPESGFACDPAIEIGVYKDRAISINANCSFEGAGEDERHDMGRVISVGMGTPAIDLGNGLITQKLSFGEHTCSIDEHLLMVDCSNADLVTLKGAYGPDCCSGVQAEVARITAPIGPIALDRETTVEGLIQLAQANSIQYNTTIVKQANAQRLQNRIDPFCGCKLHYPESEGAMQ